MKVNIMMFRTIRTGGVRLIFELANGLIERGHHVTITTFGLGNEHAWFPVKAEMNYVKFIIPAIKALKYGTRRLYIRNIIERQMLIADDLADASVDCDINLATLYLSAFSVDRSNKGVPFYFMQHDESLLVDEEEDRELANRSYELPLRQITISIWLKNLFKEKTGHDIPVVHPGVDHDTFYPREVKKTGDRFRVLCLGQQRRWKGFPEALEAMKIVMSKRSDVDFLAYGMNPPDIDTDVPYRHIRAPSDDELAELYSSADVFFSSSWYEGFGGPAIEAIACGAPIVTTRDGTEDFAFDEKNSLVVPAKDPESLADAILRLIEDRGLADKFRQEGIRTARRFTWNRMTEETEELFQETL